MKHRSTSALIKHRARLAREGKVRVEVVVGKSDAPLVREISKALNDPERATAVRSNLRQAVATPKKDFKTFLSTLPSFEGFDLDRSTQRDRDVEL